MRLKDPSVAISALAAPMVAMAIMRVVVTHPILAPSSGSGFWHTFMLSPKIYRHCMDVSLKSSRSELLQHLGSWKIRDPGLLLVSGKESSSW